MDPVFAPSTVAGIISAVATLFIAIGGVITAVGVLLPQLRKQNRKLDTIHILVNSTLTAAKEVNRLSAERELTLIRELIEVRREAGGEPDERQLANEVEAEERVASLRAELKDRARQQAIADKIQDKD